MDMSVSLDLGSDWRVLGFTLLVSLVTGIIFGLSPALQSSRPDVWVALKSDTPGVALIAHARAMRLCGGVRDEARALDKDLPLVSIIPMIDQIGFSLIPLQVAASVVGVLGVLGLGLASD